MTLPFRHCSDSRLDQIVNHGLLCAFDFDGTLAPPGQSGRVRVPLGTVLRLFELSTYAPVAVISGRPSAEIRSGLEFDPDFVLNNRSLGDIPGSVGKKGAALAQLMQTSGMRSVIYVGNEVSDEDVFQFRGPHLLSVRIGHARSSGVEFFLPHRLDVFQLLDELIARLRQVQARNWVRRASAHADSRPVGTVT
ncbi:MAG: otsB [Burkholderia sp.]|nr:otsB [Burkholderia sp.]